MRARGLLPLLILLLPLVSGQPAGQPEPARDLIVTLHDDAPLPPLPEGARPLRVLHGFVLLDAPPDVEDALRAMPGVARVDRAVPLAWHQQPTPTGAPPSPDLNLRLTRAHEAPAMGLTGAGVTVAVVDSGIDATHPDLQGRVARNVRLVEGAFVDAPGDLDGHGTHVAGIVAASGESSGGRHRGVAPDARLVGVDISSRFTTASALLAYEWLYENADALALDVVVNAWGRVDKEPFDPHDPVVRAIDRLVARGVVVLFSASNRGPDAGTIGTEAQNPRVITVGAVDAAAREMDYSSRGPVRALRGVDAWVKPDVVAPGELVVGLRSLQSPPHEDDPDALHTIMSGTSQSVPHVAGIVALMLQANESLAPVDVANALRASAIDLGAPGPDDVTGFGLVDARDAIRQARGEPNDRGNPLVAGGIERYEEQGAAAPAPARGGGLLGLSPREIDAWRTTFAVKPGATALTFDLTWSAGASPPRVTLERDDGRVVGAWTRAEPDPAGAVVRGRLDEPAPGIYTLRAHSAAPAGSTASAAIDVHLRANATRALELDSRYRLPERGWDAAPAPERPVAQAFGWARANHGLAALGVGAVVLAAASGRRQQPPPTARADPGLPVVLEPLLDEQAGEQPQLEAQRPEAVPFMPDDAPRNL